MIVKMVLLLCIVLNISHRTPTRSEYCRFHRLDDYGDGDGDDACVQLRLGSPIIPRDDILGGASGKLGGGARLAHSLSRIEASVATTGISDMVLRRAEFDPSRFESAQ